MGACSLHGSVSCQSEVMGNRATLGSPSRLRYCLYPALADDQLVTRLQHAPSAIGASRTRSASSVQPLRVVAQVMFLFDELQLGLSCLSSNRDFACVSTCSACTLHGNVLPFLSMLHWGTASSGHPHSFRLHQFLDTRSGTGGWCLRGDQLVSGCSMCRLLVAQQDGDCEHSPGRHCRW